MVRNRRKVQTGKTAKTTVIEEKCGVCNRRLSPRFRSKTATLCKRCEHNMLEASSNLPKQQGTGIVCPKCAAPTKVRRTFPHPQEGVQERYRICTACDCAMYTSETITRVVSKGNK